MTSRNMSDELTTNIIKILYRNVKFFDHIIPKCLDEVRVGPVGLSYDEVESILYDIFLGEQFIQIT